MVGAGWGLLGMHSARATPAWITAAPPCTGLGHLGRGAGAAWSTRIPLCIMLGSSMNLDLQLDFSAFGFRSHLVHRL